MDAELTRALEVPDAARSHEEVIEGQRAKIYELEEQARLNEEKLALAEKLAAEALDTAAERVYDAGVREDDIFLENVALKAGKRKGFLSPADTLRAASITRRRIEEAAREGWQSLFRSVGEMEDGPIDMIIEGALQEGTCFFGANPGDGKTLVALAFAKAICTGTALFNLPQFAVPKPRPVIYLIPESRDRAFRKRCEAFQLPDDKTKFMTRTISAGVPLELSDARLLEAVRQTNAVVFLDTASRFMKGSDENAAAQNRQLVNDVVALLAAGAVCVVLVHHATKAAKSNQERMTLENMLRGTGDFGAMCDQAYGVRKDMTLYANGSGPMEIELVSLKDREQVGGLASLRLAASYKQKGEMFAASYINQTGNFHVVSDSESSHREERALEASVKADPGIPPKELAEKLNITEYRVKSQLEKLGWHRVKGGPTGASPWHQDLSGRCPYEKLVEMKPRKTVEDAVAYLQKALSGTSPEGDCVPEADILKGADKLGISDALIGKARKRLVVVVTRESDNVAWSLSRPG